MLFRCMSLIEEKDFNRKEIVNEDVHFRMERLVEAAAMLVEACAGIREKKDAEYGF